MGASDLRPRKRASSSPGFGSIPSTASSLLKRTARSRALTRVILDELAKRGARAGVVEDVAVLTAFHGRSIGRTIMEHAREGAHRF